jgi:hypothetical protein
MGYRRTLFRRRLEASFLVRDAMKWANSSAQSEG